LIDVGAGEAVVGITNGEAGGLIEKSAEGLPPRLLCRRFRLGAQGLDESTHQVELFLSGQLTHEEV
jgi:hypothetical protein